MPWLTVLGVIPLVGTAVIAALPRERPVWAKWTALATTVVVLALTCVIAARFDVHGPRFQFTEDVSWIPAFGIHYALGVDGVAVVLLLLTAVLWPVVILASWHECEQTRRSVKTYLGLFVSMETVLIGTFVSTDLFLFYALFETMLIPMYFIIGSSGTPRASYAAMKFLLYSLAGGLLMLAAVIALYVVGPKSFLYSDLQNLHLPTADARWLFLGFFAAFAVKAPLWPLHTWLPDAVAEGPVGGSVLLVGVLDKVGTFGFLRYCLGLFPEAAHWFTPVVLVLAVIAVLYGALQAIGQRDLLRLMAYVSVSHFGLITLGVFAFTSQGQAGATLYMVNHGFSTGALLLIIGFLIARRGTRGIHDFGGVQQVAPILAGVFLLASLSGLALPGLNTFVSEFLVLVGTFTRYEVAAGFATAGIILASIYMLVMYQRTMTGPVRPHVEHVRDLSLRERVVIAPMVAVIVALGFYPGPILDIIKPGVAATLQQTHDTDPQPAVQPAAVAPSGGSS
ncbi:MAG: NADH-quinone oxidoreductase subunit M [Acidothermus sp.]|nr:NADH-quinone oxidoreductase subunit M [Acidothermus sp.]MCL6537818.1 NADH-quinone oxidoreductase subunit M [Acidothermus sp.]